MKWFYNMKISVKLIVSFLLMAAIACIVGIVGLININRINDADTLLFEENTMGINYSANAGRYYQRMKYNIAECLLLRDESQIDSYVSNISSFINTIDEHLEKYEEGIIQEEDRKMYNELLPLWQQYRTYM